MGDNNESIDINEIKQTIEARVGIPAALLRNETPEGLIMEARAILDLKRQYETEKPKSTREQFAAWLGEVRGDPQTDGPGAALDEIAKETAERVKGYPRLRDAGEDLNSAGMDSRPARDKFAEWFNDVAAFDPSKGDDGWSRLI